MEVGLGLRLTFLKKFVHVERNSEPDLVKYSTVTSS